MPIDGFRGIPGVGRVSRRDASLAFRDYILRKFRGRRIDVVIVITGTALDFVLHHHGELFPEAPIVFVGVNQPENGVTPGPGLTGLTVGIAYGETLKLALELQPRTERVFVVATAGVGNHRSRSCPTPRLFATGQLHVPD